MPAKRRRIPAQWNPFGESALGSPWNEMPADVASINETAFRKLLSELDQVRRGGRSSIVVTGEPGSGKTHLLGRLRRTIAQDVAYIYVRCNASAATLWRHVQAAVAADLLKQEAGEPSRLQSILRRDPGRVDNMRGLSLRRALHCYAEGRHVHAASAWLGGEALPDSDLDALGIGTEKDDEDRSRETEARKVVNGLLNFLAPDPTLLCFDQVEALETYRGDRDGFHTMGALIAELYHEHGHLLMVSCIVSDFEHVFEQLANKPDRDRWRENQITLRPIDWNDAVRLVKGRLDSSPELAASRREHPEDPLYPLHAEDLKPLFETTGLCLPRTLIQTCKTRFESLFGDDAVQRPPKLSRENFLQQEYEKNLKQARNIVGRQGGDKTLSESLPWLLQNSGCSPIGQDRERSQYANLAFRGESGDFAVSLCYSGGIELTNRLKRIERLWKPQALALKILRDASVKPGAKGAELLATIKARGAKEIHPLPEALAALQAIHNMIAMARSGDLRQDGQGIGEAEVMQWSLANLPPQLEQLLDDLTGRSGAEPTDDDPTLEKLAALLAERKVMEAEAAAIELKLNPEEVSACARRHPMRFGLLAGPPLVLFQAIEGPARETSHA